MSDDEKFRWASKAPHASRNGTRGARTMMMNLFARSGAGVNVETLFSEVESQASRRAKAWMGDRIKRGKCQPFTEEVTLTPEMAELLLSSNRGNRNLSQRVVEQYSTDIRQGNWEFNGQTIVVSTGGDLNDGQHRCAAVVHAGRSIKTLVVFGVPRETRMTLDQGRARTAGDYAGMMGHANANSVAAVARMVWCYLKYGSMELGGKQPPTKSQIMETLNLFPEIHEFVVRTGPDARPVGGRSFMAFIRFIVERDDAEKGREFVDKLISGEDIRSGNPIFAARGRLLNSPELRRNAPGRLDVILHAWAAFKDGRRLERTNKVVGRKARKQ